MSVKVQVVFYSMYGHIHTMAEAVAAGAREVPGADVQLFQVRMDGVLTQGAYHESSITSFHRGGNHDGHHPYRAAYCDSSSIITQGPCFGQ